MSTKLADLAPGARERAIQTVAYALSKGIRVEITSTRRTRAEQRTLRERYEDALARGIFGEPGSVQFPANRPGDSAHEHGLAFDSVTVAPGQSDDWIKIRKAFGWRVPDNDSVHAEVPQWRDAVKVAHQLGYDL